MRYSVSKEMWTETGHRLMDYVGKCSHAHGHSYRWKITAEGYTDHLDDRDMVVDFGDLKRAMARVLDQLDHAFLVREDDPLGPVLQGMRDSSGRDPQRVILLPCNPTAEALARWVGEKVQIELEEIQGLARHKARIVRVEVWETETSNACWEIMK
jgi:6-pyruvoyltetrahydropterin/6-carboxytetrahydropterin synthase